MKILVLGGTKFVGHEVVKQLLINSDNEVIVASRSKIPDIKICEIDRKSLKDLIKLLSEPFDIIIDFICFSKVDAQKLIQALEINNQKPKILMISTSYVYQNLDIRENGYIEMDFDAKKFSEIDSDWPEINYIDGKRSAEAFLIKNYNINLLCILRLPVIFGKNDPTGRTQYFIDIVEERVSVNLYSNFSGKANFVSKQDVVIAIMAIIRDFKCGTYNVAVDLLLNQFDLLLLFKDSLNQKSIDYSKINIPFSESPFYYKNDFILNTQKFYDDFNLRFDATGLIQDLKNNSNAYSSYI